MEELGNINITIRDGSGMGGGSSGSGSTGGGPGIPTVVRPRVVAPAPPPPPPTGRAPVLSMYQRFARLMDRVEPAQAMMGQIGGAIRSPSISSFTGLFAASSKTGSALAAAGAAAAPLAIALGAVVVAGAAVVGAFKALRWGAAVVEEKFRDITRFSAPMMYAQATERMAAFNRQIADANRNGAAYARAQHSATIAADAWGDISRDLGAVAASLGQTFHQFSYVLALGTKGLTNFLLVVTKAIDTMKIIVVGIGNSLLGLIPGQFGRDLQIILALLGAINNNTRPQAAAGINNWFRADIEAMTMGTRSIRDPKTGQMRPGGYVY